MPEVRTLGNVGTITRGQSTGIRAVENQPTFQPTLEPSRSPIARAPISRGTVSSGRPIEISGINPTATSPDGNLPSQPTFNNPFEVLADSFARAFGNAQYNPPLQSQAYGYTPTSGTNYGILILLLAVGVGIYLYFKNR